MKARITDDGFGHVTLEYDDWDGRRERLFVGNPGQYVHEILPGGHTRQPCYGLASTGVTLLLGHHDTLVALIRREWRRGQRRSRRDDP